MLHQDILITTKGMGGGYAVFPITARAKQLISFENCIECSEEEAMSFVKRMRALDYDVAIVDWPEDVTEANAAVLRAEDQMKSARELVAEVLNPLIDFAFEARDKKRITELFHQLPGAVERSFMIDRIRQTFPEFKEPGVTIDNWTD